MTTKLDRDGIREREKKATPGPWKSGEARNFDKVCSINRICKNGQLLVVAETTDMYHYAGKGDENANFIAHSREDIPALLAEVEELADLLEMAIEYMPLDTEPGWLDASYEERRKCRAHLNTLRGEGGPTD